MAMARPWAYFDTSALMKRYVAEPGSAGVRRLLSRHTLVSSAIAPVELTSAVYRRRAAADLTDKQVEAILGDVLRERAGWELVALTRLVTDRAEQVIAMAGLRTLDAVHVASALVFEAGLEARVPFVTADGIQAEAAERLGLGVVSVTSR